MTAPYGPRHVASRHVAHRGPVPRSGSAPSRRAVVAGGLCLALVAAVVAAGNQLPHRATASSAAGPTRVAASSPKRHKSVPTTIGAVAGAPAPTGPTTQAPADPAGSGSPVTIAFGGDVHFEGVLRQKLAAAPSTMLDPAKPLYAGADIVMVNLETAVTTRGSPESKQFTFRAPATAFTALRAAGITVATEANNHGEDFGPQGLADSLAAARAAAFPIVGIGNNAAEAFAPFRTTINGQRIAIIGATQVLDTNLASQWTATDTHPGLASADDETHLLAAVRDARATSDTVVVYLHWGTEQQTCPNPRQPPLANKLVSAGADIIVGSHAHRQLGAGRLGNAFVDYGLGNFAFYATLPGQVDSGVLAVTVRGRHVDSFTWQPARISGGVPIPLSGAAANAAVKQWQALRTCAGLTP